MQEIEFESKIKYKFSDKKLLERAFTRKALAQESFSKCHQEAFCVLGDAIIKTILCELLIQNGVDTKGEITQKKSSLESRKMLAEIGSSIMVSDYIITNEGEKSDGVIRGDRAIAETLEAIIAAIYYDKGFNHAKEVVAFLFESKLQQA